MGKRSYYEQNEILNWIMEPEPLRVVTRDMAFLYYHVKQMIK